MAETFYGPWSLLVLSKDAAFEERVTVSGSAGGDGSFPGTPGLSLGQITGEEWTIELEWSSDGGATWHPSAVRRTIDVTASDGLVTSLGADDNEPALRDGDFNDLVVSLKYLDPERNPAGPSKKFDFTFPREWLRERGPDDRRRDRPPR